MTVINTNINANIARDAIGRNDRAMATSMERLSTGLRINSAKDDAAGLAIANRMAGQISGLNMAKRNANDAMSMVQTIEGASKEIGSMLVRMRELAVQSASGTYSDTDRAALDLEFDQLRLEVTRIQEKTTWNEQALMDGSKSVSIQLGASSGQTMSIDFADWSMENEKVYGTAAKTTDIAKGTENTIVSFGALDEGESITVGGLTLTADGGDLSAEDVRAAFAELENGAAEGNDTTNGTWSGQLTGWSTGEVGLLGSVRFTSAAADLNVTDLAISSNGVLAEADTTDGAADVEGAGGSRESSEVTFRPLEAGQSITDAGLTLTATARIESSTIADGFESLAVNAIAGNNIDNGSWSGKLTGFSTAAADGSKVVFSSTTDKTNVEDIVISSAGSPAAIAPQAVLTNQGSVRDVAAVDVAETAIDAISIHNADGAAAAIVTLDKAITGITSEQAKYGAYLSRLQYASDNLSNLSTNTDQSRSRIQDADYAVETTALARTQIIAQASTAMLAQANQVKQTVLALLQ
jgi:flagellin